MPRLRPYKEKKKVKMFNALKEKRKTWELIEKLLEREVDIEFKQPEQDVWRKMDKTN